MFKRSDTGLMSLKRSEYYPTIALLFQDYDIREKMAAETYGQILLDDLKKVPKEKIEANRKVGTILNFKGYLRISWSFDMQYNKNIDLIFFPEENPYINYALLFAKDFPKSFDNEASIDRELSEITIPYDINYDFVKEILSQNTLSPMQQKRFFEVRFGSVFVPMEIEFEWYSHYGDSYGGKFSFLNFDSMLIFNDWYDYSNDLCLGVIQSYKVLPYNAPFNFPSSIDGYSTSLILTPLPTAALATTQTNIGDYLVNVRDKPDTKEGKIVTQLLTQGLIVPDNFLLDIVVSDPDDLVNPPYKAMVNQGADWYREDTGNAPDYKVDSLEYYHYKTRQAYYIKEKNKLTNPLNAEEYLVLVWNIDSKDWAKVWILMLREEDYPLDEEGYPASKEEIFLRGNTQGGFFLTGSYMDTFLESPSKLKLYEGYIHTSGLQYLVPFTENYIRR